MAERGRIWVEILIRRRFIGLSTRHIGCRLVAGGWGDDLDPRAGQWLTRDGSAYGLERGARLDAWSLAIGWRRDELEGVGAGWRAAYSHQRDGGKQAWNSHWNTPLSFRCSLPKLGTCQCAEFSRAALQRPPSAWGQQQAPQAPLPVVSAGRTSSSGPLRLRLVAREPRRFSALANTITRGGLWKGRGISSLPRP